MEYLQSQPRERIYHAVGRIKTAAYRIEQITRHELNYPTVEECLEEIVTQMNRIGAAYEQDQGELAEPRT